MLMAEIEEEKGDSEDENLLPIKEDISEWLSNLLREEIYQENLYEFIQTGTVLCEIAQIIYQVVVDRSILHTEQHRKLENDENVPPFPNPPKFSALAKPGSFLARDNAANFISWCRQLGIKDECMFESEGLVLQKQKRNVLLCLLELARIASRFGVVSPELIRLERDIEQAQEGDIQPAHSQDSILDRRKRAKILQLDEAVHKVVNKSPFRGLINIQRTGNGRYSIQNKQVFVRMLKERHVMVRVGGGWDTLEHYLLTHRTRLSSQYKLLSFTDDTIINHLPYRQKERKHHQIRTRIPLRMKSNFN